MQKFGERVIIFLLHFPEGKLMFETINDEDDNGKSYKRVRMETQYGGLTVASATFEESFAAAEKALQNHIMMLMEAENEHNANGGRKH